MSKPGPKPKKTGPSMASLIAKAGRDVLDGHDSVYVADPADRPATYKIFNVIDYIESSWGLSMTLYPVQRFIVKMFYNIPLDTTLPDEPTKRITITDMFRSKVLHVFTEKEYLEYLYDNGRCNIREQDHNRRELILACGRRGGKTSLAGIFASYEIYRLLSLGNPQKYFGLPQGNRIQVISVATDKEQAGILFNEVTAHTAKCDYFTPFLANNTQSYVTLRTPYEIDKYGATTRQGDGKFVSYNGKASLRLAFKSCVAKGLRGMGNIVIILDEFAHFQVKGQASAAEIYSAIVPSTMAFSPKDPANPIKPIGPVESRIILISSPLNKEGKFYELFHQAMSRGPGSENLLAIQAPTWEMNPTAPDTYLKQKYYADPAVFMVEHGAQFSDRLRGWLEREEDLLACIDAEHRPVERGMSRAPYFLGIDVGLINDGTTVCLCRVEGDHIIVDYHESWYAGIPWKDVNPHLQSPSTPYAAQLDKVERLDFDEIANWIVSLCQRYYVVAGLFDRWNGIPLEQALHKKGLTQFQSDFFSKDQKSKMFQAAKLMMFDRKLVLYDWPRPEGARLGRSPFCHELLNLQAEQHSSNMVVVSAPKIAGAHDDISDAFVRAVWLATEEMKNRKYIATPGAGGQRIALGSNATNYAMSRARSHGLMTDRLSPRSGLGKRLSRRI